MTIICWDGKTLAADKRAVVASLNRTVTKIFRLSDGKLFGGAGNMAKILQMKAWIENGALPEAFPKAQEDKDDWEICVVVDLEKCVYVYERTTYPIQYEHDYYACGSGRDYAIAAMHLGKSAREAVEIASLFDVGCGNGVDELTLDKIGSKL